MQSNKFILGGDFNNSVLWDKGDKQNNFSNIESFLQNLDYKSVYQNHNSMKNMDMKNNQLFLIQKKKISLITLTFYFYKH